MIVAVLALIAFAMVRGYVDAHDKQVEREVRCEVQMERGEQWVPTGHGDEMEEVAGLGRGRLLLRRRPSGSRSVGRGMSKAGLAPPGPSRAGHYAGIDTGLDTTE